MHIHRVQHIINYVQFERKKELVVCGITKILFFLILYTY